MTESMQIFEADRWTRRSRFVLAVLLALGLIPLMMLLGAGVGVAFCRGLGLPIRVQVLAAASFALPSAYLAWRVILEQPRSCVVLLPDRVEVGRGWARRGLPPGEVDWIAVPRTARQGTWVRVRGKGVDAMALIAPGDLKPCVSALIDRCPNAIFLDAKGQEHLPKRSRRPLRTLLVLERRHRELALVFAGAAPASFLFGAFILWTVLAHYRGRLPPGVTYPGAIFHEWPLLGVGCLLAGPGFAFESWRRSRKAREARMERLDLAATGRFDDEERLDGPAPPREGPGPDRRAIPR